MNKLEYLYLWLRKSPTWACGFIMGVIAVSNEWIVLDQEWLTTVGIPLATGLLVASERASVRNVKKTKEKAVKTLISPVQPNVP